MHSTTARSTAAAVTPWFDGLASRHIVCLGSCHDVTPKAFAFDAFDRHPRHGHGRHIQHGRAWWWWRTDRRRDAMTEVDWRGRDPVTTRRRSSRAHPFVARRAV